MNLVEYGRIIVQRGWIPLLLAVLTAVGAYLFSQTVTPEFRATQVMLVVPSRSDNGLTLAAERLLNNRRAYLTSEIIAREVLENTEQDLTPGELLGNTTITANQQNLTIQIDVDLTAPTAADAQRLLDPIVREWGQQLIDFQNEQNQSARQEDRILVQPQDNPRFAQLAPRPTIYAAIGGIAGLFIGAIIVFVLEYLASNLVRRRQDVEALDGLKVLASVPAD